ncbi:MAG: MFS transporter [Chloroflexi bacterium]|nr:MFS transporter [Chloroflexota bacterium]MBT4073067.1 MFS transporter [Chloroflexota bacterium]MBT6681728.1 MFS transporter [Chloroflexota bacterium]
MAFFQHTWKHYAWVIVIVAAVAQMVGSSIRMAFGVFIDPLVEGFGWSPGTVSLAYSASTVVTAVFSPVAGYVGVRYGARKAMLAGTFLFFIGMMGTAQMTQLWHLYLWYGVFLGAAQALFLIPAMPAVAQWFRRHLGLGSGLVMISWGLGPAIMVQAMAFLIESTDWKGTFQITGVIGTIIMLGLIVLFRNSPADKGSKPYGWIEGDVPQVTSGRVFVGKAKEFQRHIRHTNAFWNLINIHFLGCVGHAVILVMVVPYATSQGLSATTAAGVLSTLSAVSLFTRFATPVLGDRMGSKGVMFVSYLLQGLTVLLLLGADSVLAFYVFAFAFGIGYGGEGSVFAVINRQYYGQAPQNSTFGWQLAGAGLGMALGAAFAGLSYDLTGSYNTAIVLSAVFSLLGAVSIVLLEPTRRILIPDWDKAMSDASEESPGAAEGSPVTAGD